MPLHPWPLLDSGTWHAFHQHWIVTLCDALNDHGLPGDYFALPERRLVDPPAELANLGLDCGDDPAPPSPGRPQLIPTPPRTRLIQRAEAEIYANKADRIAVRHRHGNVVAVVEIVSPGNKASRAEFRAFIQKSVDWIRQGIHLLVVDLFPPGSRDPQGIHKAIWDEFHEDELELPADKPLTLVSYDAGPTHVAYVEFVAVGDPLPAMPLFLEPQRHIPTPLEETYQESWRKFPAPLRKLLETPAR